MSLGVGDELLEPLYAARSTAEIDSLMNEYGIPCGAVLDLHGVFSNPQVTAIGAVQRMSHPTAGEIQFVGPPYRLSATPAEVRLPPPLLGQHTDAILQSLAYSAEQIAALRIARTVA